MKMTVSEIAELCGGTLVGNGNAEVTLFYTDSRQTKPGMMFVPIRGENVDGHRFIPQVFSLGAAATFSEVPLENAAGPVVYVENARAALQAVAEKYRERFSVPIIGITGSVGKTTTKEMVALAVSAGRKTMKTAGNANSQVGLPLTVLRLEEGDEAAVLELGVSMPGEMERISKVAKPTIAIVTNIGVSHIEYMKTRENIMAEKIKIADFLPEGGKLLVNGDDDLLSTLESTPAREIVRFGFGENCAWRAEELDADISGTRFTCVHGEERFSVYVPAAGEHNVRNALAAVAAADAVGVPREAAVESITRYVPEARRQQIKKVNGVTLIDDTYNASPDSMRAALKILENVKTEGKKYAVLADMRELGDHGVQAHLEIGTFAAKTGTDILVGVNQLGKYIVEGFGKPESSVWFETNAEAIDWLKAHVQPGDVMLCKGSLSTNMNEIIKAFMQPKNGEDKT